MRVILKFKSSILTCPCELQLQPTERLRKRRVVDVTSEIEMKTFTGKSEARMVVEVLHHRPISANRKLRRKPLVGRGLATATVVLCEDCVELEGVETRELLLESHPV